jgi:hypothetical protein
LERSYPNWQADLKTLADNAPEEDQTAASQAGAKK